MERRDRSGHGEHRHTFDVARCRKCGFAPALHAEPVTNWHDEDQATVNPNPRDLIARCPICASSLQPPAQTARSSRSSVSGVDRAWEGWLEQRRVERWLWFSFAGGLCIATMLFFLRF